jgi:SAM-dependent methyltransferase
LSSARVGPLAPAEVFTKTVGDYVRYRPDYPAELANALAALTEVRPPASIVEFGSGTGIATRWLASVGYRVTAVEPNLAMRREAEAAPADPAIRYVEGSAEATGLPDACADLIVGAQCWHWFELLETDRECVRLLGPGGKRQAAAFWNLRARSPFTDAYEMAHERFVPRYAERRRAEPVLDALRARGARFREVPHHQALDLDGVLGRAHSSSYVVHMPGDPAAFDAALREGFREHAADGLVRIAYRTVLAVWEPGRS